VINGYEKKRDLITLSNVFKLYNKIKSSVW